MTIIAWDGKTLAADKRGLNSGLPRTLTKIRRIGDLLVGVSGDAADQQDVMAWVEQGRKVDNYPKAMLDKELGSSMVIIEDGKIMYYGTSPLPTVIEDKTIAMGSGRDYAIAAMHLGKSAREAVEIASLFDVGCGNGVDVLTL